MIHDGVELPRLLKVEKAATILGISAAEVEALIRRRELPSVRLNGIVHVLTESIADRLGVPTPVRRNREGE